MDMSLYYLIHIYGVFMKRIALFLLISSVYCQGHPRDIIAQGREWVRLCTLAKRVQYALEHHEPLPCPQFEVSYLGTEQIKGDIYKVYFLRGYGSILVKVENT